MKKQNLVTDFFPAPSSNNNTRPQGTHSTVKNFPQKFEDWPMVLYYGKLDCRKHLHIMLNIIRENNLLETFKTNPKDGRNAAFTEDKDIRMVFDHPDIRGFVTTGGGQNFFYAIMHCIASKGWEGFCKQWEEESQPKTSMGPSA